MANYRLHPKLQPLPVASMAHRQLLQARRELDPIKAGDILQLLLRGDEIVAHVTCVDVAPVYLTPRTLWFNHQLVVEPDRLDFFASMADFCGWQELLAALKIRHGKFPYRGEMVFW